MPDQYVERVVDLTDPADNRIPNLTLEDARARVARGTPADVRSIDGSFALVGREGRRVRLARSLDRPLRYFLAKQSAGPALVVADRIDAIHECAPSERASPASSIPATRAWCRRTTSSRSSSSAARIPSRPTTRFFTPGAAPLPPDLDAIGAALRRRPRRRDRGVARSGCRPAEPIGVAFSGGIDSGAVFLADLPRCSCVSA